MFNNIKKVIELQKQMKSLDLNNLNMDELLNNLGLDEDKLKKQTDEIFRFKHQLRYTKIHEDATEPKYNYESDSGFDLHSIENVLISPMGRALVKTESEGKKKKSSWGAVERKATLKKRAGDALFFFPPAAPRLAHRTDRV